MLMAPPVTGITETGGASITHTHTHTHTHTEREREICSTLFTAEPMTNNHTLPAELQTSRRSTHRRSISHSGQEVRNSLYLTCY